MIKIKKTILALVLTLTITMPSPIDAKSPTQDSTQLPCDVLKDAFVSSLFKPINDVLALYNDKRQFMVDKVVEIRRLAEGQYYWEATLKVTTFEGAHNPPYLYYTITFTNLHSEVPRAVKVEKSENN